MRTSYTVIPTFSCGSSASVDRATAERVAREEQQGFEHARSGIYGETVATEAPRRGLDGIVYSWTEVGRHSVRVHDLITDEFHAFKTFQAFQAWGSAARERTRRYLNVTVAALAVPGR